MIRSRAHFEDECVRLCGCLQRFVSDIKHVEGSSLVATKDQKGAFDLLRWELVRSSTDNSLYLKHATVTTTGAESEIRGDRRQPQIQHDGHDFQEYSLEDDTILVDPELDVEATTGRSLSSLIHWTFSVVYSDTYRVPVLYFHVQNADGSPCSRSQVLQWLAPNSCKESVTTTDESSSWEFVSQEQHPCTGFPSYFLHPCRTSERMTLLQQVEAMPPENESSEGETLSSGIHVLWAWMSMMLPAINHTIPPKVFRLVQHQLQQKKKSLV